MNSRFTQWLLIDMFYLNEEKCLRQKNKRNAVNKCVNPNRITVPKYSRFNK